MAINRREAIRKATYFMGGTLSAPAILGVLNGCAPDPKPGWKSFLFTDEQALTVQELAETIIPATETLGAKDLGVPKFIEEMVGIVYKDKDKTEFLEGLNGFMQEVADEYGKSFRELESAQRLEVAKAKNNFITNPANRAAWKDKPPFFWRMKELTMLGFFTSEYGATRILQYELVPASWEACIPLSEAGEGRTWAT